MSLIRITFSYHHPITGEVIFNFYNPVTKRLSDETIAEIFAQHCLERYAELYDFSIALLSSEEKAANIDTSLRPKLVDVISDFIAWKRSVLTGILDSAVPV